MSAALLPAPLDKEVKRESEEAEDRFHSRVDLNKKCEGNDKALRALVRRWVKEGHLRLE